MKVKEEERESRKMRLLGRLAMTISHLSSLRFGQ